MLLFFYNITITLIVIMLIKMFESFKVIKYMTPNMFLYCACCNIVVVLVLVVILITLLLSLVHINYTTCNTQRQSWHSVDITNCAQFDLIHTSTWMGLCLFYTVVLPLYTSYITRFHCVIRNLENSLHNG